MAGSLPPTAWAVGAGGVGVQDIQGELGAGVAEVVLLPPLRQQSSPAARSVREVSAWICRVPPPLARGPGAPRPRPPLVGAEQLVRQ